MLHDIGKLEAYNDDPLAIDMTDLGRLQGEIPLGYYRVRSEIESIEGFDPDLAQSVLHIILSHHGSLEHGSPVGRATREGTVVHMMDNLGGKLGRFDRIERTAVANGWEVIQLRHGTFRKSVFAKQGGKALQTVMETKLSDYHFQALVWKRDAKSMRAAVIEADSSCKKLIESLSDDEVVKLFYDVGGHDHQAILEAFEHKNNSGPSMSSSAPLRPMQVWDALRAARSGSAKTGPVNSVGKKPGPIAFAVMPSRDQASAMPRVSWATPALEAP